MTGKCDHCGKAFDTQDGGTRCKKCGKVYCPTCEVGRTAMDEETTESECYPRCEPATDFQWHDGGDSIQ